jgi:antitoxin PrlF
MTKEGLMPSAVLTTKGQITIPAEVRKEMGLSTGDRVYFILNKETGRFEVTRKTGSLLDLAGYFKHEGPPVTIEEMNEAIADAAVARYLRCSEKHD